MACHPEKGLKVQSTGIQILSNLFRVPSGLPNQKTAKTEKLVWIKRVMREAREAGLFADR